MVELDLRESEDQRPELEGELEELVLATDPSKTTKIGGSMNDDLKLWLIQFLRQNHDVFPWTHVQSSS